MPEVPEEPLQDLCPGCSIRKGEGNVKGGSEDSEKEGVKGSKEGSSPEGGGGAIFPKFPEIPGLHLLCRCFGKGENEDALRGDVLLPDEKEDVLNKRKCLSAPGAGKAEHRPRPVGDGDVLCGIADWFVRCILLAVLGSF